MIGQCERRQTRKLNGDVLIEMWGPHAPGAAKKRTNYLGEARGGFFEMKFKLAPERWRYQRLAKWRGHRGMPERSKTGQFSLPKGKNCPSSFQEWAKEVAGARLPRQTSGTPGKTPSACSSPRGKSILWSVAPARVFTAQV